MRKRAVLYARVSSDDRGKDGRNLAGQLGMCRKYAQERSWRVVAELAEDDRGASGASFELPRLDQVPKMAQSGGFDILIVRESDRLSRNLAKQLVVEEEMKRHGVQVNYMLADYPDTPEGRLNKYIRATIAEYEREKINERTIRGRRQKVQAGNVLVFGRPSYGYRVADKDGKTTLVVCESEAHVVRLIYTWYTSGDDAGRLLSLSGIARELSRLRIPTHADTHAGFKKRGRGEWDRGAVPRILKNETYTGSWHNGKTKGPHNGRRTRTPKEDRLMVEVASIVSDELWQAAQDRLQKNRRNTQNSPKHPYLLGRRVTCGACGLKMSGHSGNNASRKTYRYYRCPATFKKDSVVRRCDAPGFPVRYVDVVVWDWVKSFLTNPEALRRGLWEVHQERERASAPVRGRLAVVNGLLSSNRAQLERLLGLYLSGEFPREMLIDHKARLEKTAEVLERERASLVTPLETQTLTEDQLLGLQESAAAVAKELNAMDDDFVTRRQVIEALDVQANLAVEDGQKVVYTRCLFSDNVRLQFHSTCARIPPTGRSGVV
jgi:site-specific DNA recombinase